MNLLFLGRSDHANASHRTARAINRAKREIFARVIVQNDHKFGYEQDCVLSPGQEPDDSAWQEAAQLIYDADWIVGTGDSDYDWFSRTLAAPGSNPHKARFATQHGGSKFRAKVWDYRKTDEDDSLPGMQGRKFERWFMSYSLYRLVSDSPKACVHTQPVDTIADYPPSFNPDLDRLKVCHAPSNTNVKGTAEIEAAVKGLDIDFRVVCHRSYADVMACKRKSHVYIDQLNPAIGGWGGGATEALSQGLLVLSDIRNVSRGIEQWIVAPPILHVTTGAELRNEVEDCVSFLDEIGGWGRTGIEWCKRYLSPEATAKHWEGCLDV